MEYRVEHDSMGEVRVPADKYWGAQTERSHNNFPIGVGIETMPAEIIHAFGILKKAAARANRALRPEKMTEEKLAELTDRSDREIRNIESGVSIPKLDTVIKISNALNMEIGDLTPLKETAI